MWFGFIQIFALSLFLTSVFACNAGLISHNSYDSYQISSVLRKHPSGVALSIYSKNDDSSIIWKNTGYVGYELGYRYETNGSKSFFISDMVGSSCSYWFGDYEIDTIKKTISSSETSYAYRGEYSGDYLSMACDTVLDNAENYWERYNKKGYCYITAITAEQIIKRAQLESRDELLGKCITIKKRGEEPKNLILAGILSQPSIQPYYQLFGDFILSHQSNIVENLDSYGISIKYMVLDTQGINQQLKFLSTLLGDAANYSYSIDAGPNISFPLDREVSYDNILYLIPAALLMAGVYLVLRFLGNRYSFKRSHIVFNFSALFWLMVFQITSIPIFSATQLVVDSYSIFFVYTFLVALATLFTLYVKKTNKGYAICYSRIKI